MLQPCHEGQDDKRLRTEFICGYCEGDLRTPVVSIAQDQRRTSLMNISAMSITFDNLAEGMDVACEQLRGVAWEAVEFMREWLHANEDDFREFLTDPEGE